MKIVLLSLITAVTLTGCGTVEFSPSYPSYYDSPRVQRRVYVSEPVYHRQYTDYRPYRDCKPYRSYRQDYPMRPYYMQGEVNLNFNRHYR